jgi:hypothetical protein
MTKVGLFLSLVAIGCGKAASGTFVDSGDASDSVGLSDSHVDTGNEPDGAVDVLLDRDTDAAPSDGDALAQYDGTIDQHDSGPDSITDGPAPDTDASTTCGNLGQVCCAAETCNSPDIACGGIVRKCYQCGGQDEPCCGSGSADQRTCRVNTCTVTTDIGPTCL